MHRSKPKSDRGINNIKLEITSLALVLSLGLIEIAHILHTSWTKLFLYDGDSLTLPIIRQSLARKEHIQWVFSSQLNLFPEGILYTVSSIFARSISNSLILNGLLNVLLFYVLVRFILKYSLNASSSRIQIILSVICCALLIGLMLSELPDGHSNQSQATYYLFTSYYYGLVLVGLVQAVYILRQLASSRVKINSPGNVALFCIFVTTTLTTASNPLYLIQFTLPFLAILFIYYVMKVLKLKQFITMSIYTVIGPIAGIVMRLFLKPFIGQSLGDHAGSSASYKYSISSFFYLLNKIAPLESSFLFKFRLLLGIILYFSCLFYVLLYLKKHKDSHQRINPTKLFMLLLSVISPIVVLLFISSITLIQERYLIVSPLLLVIGVVIILMDLNVKKLKVKHLQLLVSLIVSSIIFGGFYSALYAIKEVKNSDFTDSSCITDAFKGGWQNGVGDYWTVRALDVYNTQNVRFLQVKEGLKVFAWLNNVSTYQNKEFTFVVIDRSTSLTLADTYGLSESPTSTTVCPHNLTIYKFNRGTPGYYALNLKVKQSLEIVQKARADGAISEYNAVSGRHSSF